MGTYEIRLMMWLSYWLTATDEEYTQMFFSDLHGRNLHMDMCNQVGNKRLPWIPAPTAAVECGAICACGMQYREWAHHQGIDILDSCPCCQGFIQTNETMTKLARGLLVWQKR